MTVRCSYELCCQSIFDLVTAQCSSNQDSHFTLAQSGSLVVRASDEIAEGRGFKSDLGLGFLASSQWMQSHQHSYDRPYSYSQYWTGTGLQWRLMRENLFKCKYFLIYSPALASIASLFQSNTENTNMVYSHICSPWW